MSSVRRDHKRVEGLASSSPESRKAFRAFGGENQKRFHSRDWLGWLDRPGGERLTPGGASPFDALPAAEAFATGGTGRVRVGGEDPRREWPFGQGSADSSEAAALVGFDLRPSP